MRFRKGPLPSKQKSLALIQRLYKQLDSTYRTLDRLYRVLPGFIGVSPAGQRGLEWYANALHDLENALQSFPDDPSRI